MWVILLHTAHIAPATSPLHLFALRHQVQTLSASPRLIAPGTQVETDVAKEAGWACGKTSNSLRIIYLSLYLFVASAVRLTPCLSDYTFDLRQGHAIGCSSGGLGRRLIHSMTGVLESALVWIWIAVVELWTKFAATSQSAHLHTPILTLVYSEL